LPVFILFSLLVPNIGSSAQLSLAWDPNSESDINGYRIYYGTVSNNYSHMIDVGSQTSCTLNDLVPGETYYIAATAYDTLGNESTFSEEIAYTVPYPDTDGDGALDNHDAFPLDPAESTDTDGDGIGNNADDDDDNDGLPDDWEILYGLNPLFNDAAEDPDEDGVGNLEEYLAGTIPTIAQDTTAPEAPELLLPYDDDLVALTPELRTDAFYDPDFGDSHRETQWQIFSESSDFCVMDVRSSVALTALTVPELMLDQSTTYIWRVKFFNNHGTPSDWSPFGFFTTAGSIYDRDGNGILDHQEIDETIDLDGDGIADIDQDDIKCLNIDNSMTQIGVSIKDSDTVSSITSLESQDPDECEAVAESTGKPDDLPLGLIKFKLVLNNPGDTAEVTLYLSEPPPDGGRWYKFNPIDKTWLDFTDYTVFSEDRMALRVTLQDGGPGDVDGIANGIIIDPLGFGTSTKSTKDSNSGSDSGSNSGPVEDIIDTMSCFITAASPLTAASQSRHSRYNLSGLVLAAALLLILIRIGHEPEPLDFKPCMWGRPVPS
jgi:hypothetical protein